MSRKEYFAYGSNLNFDQMVYRCPEATAVGIAKLNGYELAFRRGYLTILPKEGAYGTFHGHAYRINRLTGLYVYTLFYSRHRH